jgi:hypothetical protein
MKKFLSVLALMITMIFVNAQDFKKVQTSMLISKYESAKEEYDKAVAKKPSLATTAEGYYWKAKIYSGFQKDATIAGKYPNAYEELKKAILTYAAMDTSMALAKENGQEPFFDVYTKSFKDGVAGFNEKKWKIAAASFDDAVVLSDIIFSKGWASSKSKFDTTSIIYAGYSNQNAGNEEKTMGYYKRLIDYKLNAPELIDVYRYFLVKLINKKDKAAFDTYVALAETAYPKETWVDYRTEFIEKSLTIDEKIKLYDELSAANKLTEIECQLYGDMFMAAKGEENVTPENVQKYILKAAEAYKKAFDINNKNYAAAFNVGISYYNQYVMLDDKKEQNIKALQAINTNKPVAPKDPKQKAAFDLKYKLQIDSVKKLNTNLDVDINAKVDVSIEWLEKAYNVIKDKAKLEKAEKNVALRSVDYLATLYGYKRDKTRGKDQKASDAYDAKFNAYDKLHDKYQ